MKHNGQSEKGGWLKGLIEAFIDSSENALGNSAGDRAFSHPVVGFASGADPVFDFFKKDIGSFYLTPLEFFEKTYPGTEIKKRGLTVISWVLPHIAQTKIDNRNEILYPSERWARGKYSGMLVNIRLQKYLVETLTNAGIRAMAPVSPLHWSEGNSEKYGHSSNWSERHAAYAAGLGTFGLCDGLITPVGKAMRCGSIIAEIDIPATKRPYESHTEYCLYLTDGSCGACISRCPVGAITKNGHDKNKCKNHVDQTCVEYAREHYEIDINVCGLCQTKVPCESQIPGRRKEKSAACSP